LLAVAIINEQFSNPNSNSQQANFEIQPCYMLHMLKQAFGILVYHVLNPKILQEKSLEVQLCSQNDLRNMPTTNRAFV